MSPKTKTEKKSAVSLKEGAISFRSVEDLAEYDRLTKEKSVPVPKAPLENGTTSVFIPLRAERQRIAAQASCDERSVKRAYEGQMIRSTTRERIVAAAHFLKIAPPPEIGS